MMDTEIIPNRRIPEEISEIHEEERYGREEYFRNDTRIPEEERYGREEISEITKVVVESLYVNITDVQNSRRIDKLPTIHQISADMRKENESAYTPTQFPIGPYHRHHEDKLLFLNGETIAIKILYLNDLLKRNTNHNKLENYASAIESREDEARDFYHDRCKGFQSKDFVEMMVLDGCFMVELFLKCWEKRIDESWIDDVVHDLMLLENQIPFFILKLIHDHNQYQVEGNPGIFLDLALGFLEYLGCSAGKNITKDRLEEDGKNIYHLLHLNYLCHMVEIDLESQAEPDQDSCLVLDIVTLICWVATELKEYGVMFERKKNARNYMDVSFENKILEIPVVSIDDSTNSTFRNFLALEYFCPNLGNKFTTYVVLLDDLIDTTSDVSFLKNRKIIENMVGRDEDVAKLFNAITDDL